MKRRVLQISLLVNICLGLLAAYEFKQVRPAPAPVLTEASVDPAPEVEPNPAGVKQGVPEQASVAVAPHPAPPKPSPEPLRLNWRSVESTDYRTYIANLRAIGCPEQTIREIIAADVQQTFAGRRAAGIAAKLGDFRYWDTKQASPETSEEFRRQREEIDEQMHETLVALLGTDQGSQSDRLWLRGENDYKLAFLPESAREQLREINDRYPGVDAQQKQLAEWHQPTDDPEEMQDIIARYEAKKAEIAVLLTPEELERYEMSVSWTADNLRRAMAKFDPTPEEFQVIYREWRKQDEMLATLKARNEPDPGNTQVFENIRQTIGDERFALYRETWWK